MDGWGIFVPGTTMGEIPRTSTRVHVPRKNGALLCTICIMGRNVAGMIVIGATMKARSMYYFTPTRHVTLSQRHHVEEFKVTRSMPEVIQ